MSGTELVAKIREMNTEMPIMLMSASEPTAKYFTIIENNKILPQTDYSKSVETGSMRLSNDIV